MLSAINKRLKKMRKNEFLLSIRVWSSCRESSAQIVSSLSTVCQERPSVRIFFSTFNYELKEIPLSLFSLKPIEQLELINASLSFIPPQISLLQNLTSLTLRNNDLTRLPIAIGGLPRLTHLFVFGNHCFPSLLSLSLSFLTHFCSCSCFLSFRKQVRGNSSNNCFSTTSLERECYFVVEISSKLLSNRWESS